MSDPASEQRLLRIGDKVYHLTKRRDGAGMELVEAYPDDVLPKEAAAERVRAVEAYGAYRPAPRKQNAAANIERPVNRRTQTILSHEVDAATQARLHGGLAPHGNRGRR